MGISLNDNNWDYINVMFKVVNNTTYKYHKNNRTCVFV